MEVLLGLVVKVLEPVLSLAVKLGLDRMQNVLGQKRLAEAVWRLDQSERVDIVLATGRLHPDDPEGTLAAYPAEYAAALKIVNFLQPVYKHVTFKVSLSDEFHQKIQQCTDSLIVIGGPVHNPLAKDVLEYLGEKGALPYIQNDYTIERIVGAQSKPECYEAEFTDNAGATPARTITKDACLVVGVNNPFASGTRWMLLSGSRTYGVLAGANALTPPGIRETISRLESRDNFAMVVGCDVDLGVPIRNVIAKVDSLNRIGE